MGEETNARGQALRRTLAVILGTPSVMLGRPWVFDLARLVAFLLVAVLSAWLAVSSLFFWGAPQHPGAHGVVALVAAGAPAWIVVVPLPAVLTLLCLLWPRPGKFSAALCCIVAVFALTIGAGAAIQYDQGHRAAVDLATGLSVPVVLLLMCFALPLAMNDLVAPDRSLANLARIWSARQTQLYDLYQWGRAHGWQVRTISGRAVGVSLQGALEPRTPPVHVIARSLCAHASRPPRLSLRLEWPEERRGELPWFHLGTTPPRVPLPAGTVVICWRRGLGHPFWCYVGPSPNGHVASKQHSRSCTGSCMEHASSSGDVGHPSDTHRAHLPVASPAAVPALPEHGNAYLVGSSGQLVGEA